MQSLISVIDDQTDSATPEEMAAIDAVVAEGPLHDSTACNRTVELRPLVGA